MVPSDGRGRLSEQGREIFQRFVTLRWVPLTEPLSAAAILLSLQQPELILLLPDQIRVAQGRESGSAFVFLDEPGTNRFLAYPVM